jgi:hypothetical protein
MEGTNACELSLVKGRFDERTSTSVFDESVEDILIEPK